MVASLELSLQPCVHLVEGSHPHESVDGDSLFAPAERRVEECRGALSVELSKGRLQSEENRRVGAQHLIGYAAQSVDQIARVAEERLIAFVAHGVAAQVGQCRALSRAADAVALKGDIVRMVGGVHAAAGSRRLFEVQHPVGDLVFHDKATFVA